MTKTYYTLYKSSHTVIRIEGDHFSWRDARAEILTETDDPTLGSVWQKETYDNLNKLMVALPDPDLFCEICRLSHADDIQATETNIDSESYNEDAYSEELTISFRDKTARIYWSPAAAEILTSAIGIGFAYALDEF